jgi:hypothetical protein
MATLYDEIYDLALVTIRDYKLDELYTLSPTDFGTYMEGFLIRAIPKFTNCSTNLDDRDDTLKKFNNTLSGIEKNILAELTIITWFEREVQNVTQFNLHLNDTDFKRYAESNNLKEKQNYLAHLREVVAQDMVSYELKQVDWSAWANGNFGL